MDKTQSWLTQLRKHQDELFPIRTLPARAIWLEPGSWIVALLAIVPLLAAGSDRTMIMEFGFAAVLAVIWAVAVGQYVLRSRMPIRTLATAFFLGGLAVAPLWLGVWSLMPASWTSAALSSTLLFGFVAYLLVVALPVELCKLLPFFGFWGYARKKATRAELIQFAVISGLGYAVFERLLPYEVHGLPTLSAEITAEHAEGIRQASQLTAVTLTIESAAILCHALWTGIVAALAVRATSVAQTILFVTVGWLWASTFHAAFACLAPTHVLFAGGLVLVSFAMFRTYLHRPLPSTARRELEFE